MTFSLAESQLLIIPAGFLTGFLVGMTGVGGGALTTPMLIQGFGVSPAVAVGTDLLFAALTKSSAAWRHHRYGNVDWRVLGWLAGGSLPGASMVIAWLYLAHPDTASLTAIIRKTMAVTLVITAVTVAVLPWIRANCRYEPRREGAPVERPFAAMSLGLVIGVMVALTSVGAGALGVAALTCLFPALVVRRVVGTDIVHAIPLAMLAGLGHLGLGNIDFTILALLLVGSVPGIALGTRCTSLVPDWALRLLLATVLLYAAYMLVPRGSSVGH